MDPTLIGMLLKILIVYGPQAYRAAVELFHNEAPTKDDFMRLLDFATQNSYEAYIAGTNTPPAIPPVAGG